MSRCAIPTIVKTRVNPNSLRLHQSIERIRTGQAEQRDWAILYQSSHFLAFAGAYSSKRSRIQAENAAELGYIACANLRDRFESTGKIGANGEELAGLIAFAEGFDDFFRRASASIEERGHNDLAKWLKCRQEGVNCA